MRKLGRAAGLVLSGALISAAPARADVVTEWNAITVAAVTVQRPGVPGLFDIALVHAAIHDAVQAIEGEFEPYHYSDPTKLGVGSPEAAAAAAAHRILVLLYPTLQTTFDAAYETYLSTHGLVGDGGLAVGEAAATSLYNDEYRPVIAVEPFVGRTEIGQWRSSVPLAFLYMASSEPFTLNRVSQFRPQPPPPLTSGQYLRDYNEVKAAGASAVHPNGTTNMALFWSLNFVTQWNEALRRIAETHLSDIGDSARLFALANLAAADSAMAVWEAKYHYNFWRPSTAIRQAADDGNKKTEADVAWTPLFADPPYPDYPSGANGLSGAFLGILQLFFGTNDFSFSVKTTSANVLVTEKERQFTSFSQAAQEVVDARMLLGIHFRFADEEAMRLGGRVAHWVFQKFLRPVPGSSSDQ